MNPAFKRIAEATGAKTQVDLADILEIRQSSISDAKRRNSVPDTWLVALLKKFSLNPDWILTGNGERYLVPAGLAFNVAQLPENPAAGTQLEKVLKDIIDAVTTARGKHSYLGRSFNQAVCAVRSESLEWEAQAILSQEPDGALRASRRDYLVPEGWRKEPQ